jgi:hypothetical protein
VRRLLCCLRRHTDFACSYPSDTELVATIRKVRREYLASFPDAELDVLYVATNAADGRWWSAFRGTLRRDGWQVVSAKDLALDSEQQNVGLAVDMEIARLAAVFLGNGVGVFLASAYH